MAEIIAIPVRGKVPAYSPWAQAISTRQKALDAKKSEPHGKIVEWGIPLSDEGKAKVEKMCVENKISHLNIEASKNLALDLSGLNASVDYEGNIEISVLAMDKCNETEILAAISHEVGHKAHGDVTEQKPKTSESNELTIFDVALVVSLISYVIRKGTFKERCKRLSGIVAYIFTNIAKDHEYAADKFAVENGHGEGLISFLKKIRDEKSFWKLVVDVVRAPVSTHPLVYNRIRHMKRWMAEAQENKPSQ